MPELIEHELAARVVHEDAKSWDLTPFYEEMRRFDSLYRPVMTRRERALHTVDRRLLDLGWFKVTAAASRARRRMGLPGRRANIGRR
jgi:hypothetical protein